MGMLTGKYLNGALPVGSRFQKFGETMAGATVARWRIFATEVLGPGPQTWHDHHQTGNVVRRDALVCRQPDYWRRRLRNWIKCLKAYQTKLPPGSSPRWTPSATVTCIPPHKKARSCGPFHSAAGVTRPPVTAKRRDYFFFASFAGAAAAAAPSSGGSDFSSSNRCAISSNFFGNHGGGGKRHPLLRPWNTGLTPSGSLTSAAWIDSPDFRSFRSTSMKRGRSFGNEATSTSFNTWLTMAADNDGRRDFPD